MRNTRSAVALAASFLLLPTLSAAQTAPVTAATASADFGRGVTFRTEDGRFSLNIRGRIQARVTVSEQPERPQTEFQIRRMRLALQGNFLGEDLRYNIQLAFSNLDTEPDLRVPLRDAYVTWQGVRDLNVRFGQMKVPYGRQRVVSSASLQFADRSVAVGELNLDRDVGVVAFSRDLFGLGRRLTYDLGVFGGDGRNRLTEDFGALYAARLQFQPFGEFDDLAEADTLRLDRPRLAVAVSGAYNQRSRRARSTFGDTYSEPFDQLHAAVDLLFKWRGLSLQAEALYRRADADSHVVGADSMGQSIREWSRSGLGYYVQAGCLLTSHAEVAARWGEVFPDAGTSPTLRRSRELGGALSWYFQRHDFKLQADYFYLADEDFADGRHQARLQAQLFF